jgi:hypothetical protein
MNVRLVTIGVKNGSLSGRTVFISRIAGLDIQRPLTVRELSQTLDLTRFFSSHGRISGDLSCRIFLWRAFPDITEKSIGILDLIHGAARKQ